MRYFTSDTHFWHTNVIRYCNRPFATVEEMNEKLIYNWNKVVTVEDTVYHLGDFSMAFRSVELFTQKLNGLKILVPGNHDFCHITHKRGRKQPTLWTQKYVDNGWGLVIHDYRETLMRLSNGQKILMNHFPYSLDHSADVRFKEHRIPLHNVPHDTVLLHGHIHFHGGIAVRKEPRLQIDVGVDCWDYAPISETFIEELIKKASQ